MLQNTFVGNLYFSCLTSEIDISIKAKTVAVGDGLKKLVLVFPRTRDPVPVLMIP